MSNTFGFRAKQKIRLKISQQPTNQPTNQPTTNQPTARRGKVNLSKVNEGAENVDDFTEALATLTENMDLSKFVRGESAYMRDLNTGLFGLYTEANGSNFYKRGYVEVFTTSDMTPYFYPKGYAIPQQILGYGTFPLVTTNHMVPMDDNVQNVGALRRKYHKLFSSKVYTNAIVMPLFAMGGYQGDDTILKVSFTDKSKPNIDMVGWQFVATNFRRQQTTPQSIVTDTRVVNFVAGSAAGEIRANDVKCTNLYVDPPFRTASATVQVNGSISCNTLTVGGSNLQQYSTIFNQSQFQSSLNITRAMSFLKATTICTGHLKMTGFGRTAVASVHVYLSSLGLASRYRHILVWGIKHTIVAATINRESLVETTHHSSTHDMFKDTTGLWPLRYWTPPYDFNIPQDQTIYITITVTIDAYVNPEGIEHQSSFNPNPPGTRITVACPPLRVATPITWEHLYLPTLSQ